MSITDVRVQVPPRAPRSTGGLPSGGTPQRGDTGSKVHIDARVVELADSLDSGSSVHYGRAGSSPASRTKKKDTLKACLSFWVLRAVGPTPLRRFKCSAEVNSASAKVLPAAKHPHGALVPPARRPVGWFPHTFSGFQNIDMNAPSKEKDIRIGCPSLSFCPPEAAQTASLLWRNFLDKRGRTL